MTYVTRQDRFHGNNVLHLCVVHNLPAMFTFLLSRNVAPMQSNMLAHKNADGLTPLQLAAAIGCNVRLPSVLFLCVHISMHAYVCLFVCPQHTQFAPPESTGHGQTHSRPHANRALELWRNHS